MWCMVCFEDSVPKKARADLEKGVPSPLAGYFDWKDKHLVFGNDDDSLQWVVRATYDHVQEEDDEYAPDPELPSDAMWKAFNAELDRWLLGVHAAHPIALVIKPIDEEYSTATDAWHDWSCERIPSQVLPIAEKLDNETAQYVADMWRAWVEEQPFEAQQKLVDGLAPGEKKVLAKRGVLVDPKPAVAEPVKPSLDQFVQLWRNLVAQGGPMRLEDAFEAALIERGLSKEYSLSNHIGELRDEARTDEAIELCRAVLASGAEFPTNWYPTLADLLIDAGRLDEAEPIIRKVVGSLESYKPDMLVTAMRYHAGRGERDIEALLYHAGMEWFTTFSYSVPKAQAKAYGARPKDLADQFMAWLERWLAGTHWIASTMTDLAHWLVWFDKIGKERCKARVEEFEAERDRRNALYAQLAEAQDEARARALVDLLAPTATADRIAHVAHQLAQRAPLAAYELLDRAIANEGRTGFRSPRGDRVGAVVNIMYLALNQPALADKLAHVYEIARGYVLVSGYNVHFNLACVACRLGKRTEALGHVARALALDFPSPQQIHDDNDLAPLRGDQVFEKLFVDDAIRRETAARLAVEAEQKKATKKRSKKPSAKKPAAKKPAAKKPAAKKPAKAAKKKPGKKK